MTPTSQARPRVKICGLTNASDTRRSIELGAEMIGLNFYPDSPRYIEPERAAALVREVGRERATWIGVFVNERIERALEIADQVGLDLLQFHGDETPEQIAPIAQRSIKALRVRGDLERELLDAWRDLGLWGLLIDARHETLYGGSGERWNVESLPQALGLGGDSGSEVSAPDQPRVLVAGGLNPSNAAESARSARPWGLDLCSGVESAPGEKDPALLAALFETLGADFAPAPADSSSRPKTSSNVISTSPSLQVPSPG